MTGILVSANAGVEDRASFVCTTQLDTGVEHLFPSTFFTCSLGDGFRLSVFSCQGLHCGSLRAEGGGEGIRFRFRDDSLRNDICRGNELI